MIKPRFVPYLVFLLLSIFICRNFLILGETFIATDFVEKRVPWGKGPDADVKNSIAFDSVEYVYQYANQYDKEIEKGKFFLWDPYTFCGHPGLADFQSSQIYPPKIILHLLFDTYTAYGLFIFIHFFLAGCAMYIFLKKLDLSLNSALFGSCVWMLSGQLTVCFRYAYFLICFVFIPIFFLFLVSAVKSRKFVDFVKAGIAVGFLCLGGNQQYTFYALGGGLIYLIFAGLENRTLLWSIGGYCCSLFIGCCVGAIQLLPSLELMANGTVSGYEFPGAFKEPLKMPMLLLTLLFPRILGGPFDRVDLMRRNLGTNMYEFQGYIGILALIVAIFAVPRNRAIFKFCIVIAIGSLLLATCYPVYQVLKNIPGFSAVPPQRIFLYTFCVSILAAFGFENLKQASTRLLKPLVIFALIALVACGAMFLLVRGKQESESSVHGLLRWLNISNPHIYTIFISLFLVILALFFVARGSRFASGVAILSCIVELLIFFVPYNSTYRPQVLSKTPEAIYKIKEDKGHYRVLAAIDSNEWRLPARNMLMMYDIASPEGLNTIFPRSYAQYMKKYDVKRMYVMIRDHDSAKPSKIYDPVELGKLNVKYIITEEQLEGFEKVHDGDVKIYRNDKARPRAFIESSGAEATIQTYETQKVVIKATAQKKDRIILLDNFYPGWQCKVNGGVVNIEAFEGTFRGVEIGAGENTIEFEYVPFSFKFGFIVSVVTVFLAIVILWRFR